VNADDRLIITEVLKGHAEAFGELVHRYQDRLYNLALRVVGNPDDAADVVQETFLSAYQSLKSFKGDSEIYTWLYRIAFNASITARRKKRSVVSLDATRRQGDSDLNLDPIDTSVDVRPEAALERSEDEIAVATAMAKLSEEHRTVLTLKDIEGLKYEEIAEIIGTAIGTVRSRLHRARLELRSLLDPTASNPLEPGSPGEPETSIRPE
jgi:RNA polymerase sigma-70 factor (ECF subfamily)